MVSKDFIKTVAVITLLLFCSLILKDHYGYTQVVDPLTKGKENMKHGYFDEAKRILIDFTSGVPGEAPVEKFRLAHAYYLLSQIYFNDEEKKAEARDKMNNYLKELFQMNLNFTPGDAELDPEFRKELEAVKKLVEAEQIPNGGNVIVKTGTKKKKKFPVLLVLGGVVVITALILLLSKKKKGKKLTVNADGGVSGTPMSGTYTHKKGETVKYDFTLNSGYKDLVVILDGNSVAATGSVTMDRDHTLSATTTKIGHISSVTVNIYAEFAASGLRTQHQIWVDQSQIMNEILVFNARPTDVWDDADKIYRSFTVNTGPDKISIRQEAGPYYEDIYLRSPWIWATYYLLEITNYTYEGGSDPGMPTLSEELVSLSVAPWHDDPDHEWYRIETKEILINPPVINTLNGKNKNDKFRDRTLKCSAPKQSL